MPAVRVRFEDLAVANEVPPLSRVVTRGDVKRYADASGDQNPLHQNNDVAGAAGFPGIIGHGMFTMGHLARCLAEWLGDAGSLVRMRAQFRAPVFMGETMVASGRVKSLDPETRVATLEMWVTVERAGTTEYAIRKSEAEVRLPEGG